MTLWRIKTRPGFTLLEMLTVIAVVILLMAISLPAILRTAEGDALKEGASIIQNAFYIAKTEAKLRDTKILVRVRSILYDSANRPLVCLPRPSLNQVQWLDFPSPNTTTDAPTSTDANQAEALWSGALDFRDVIEIIPYQIVDTDSGKEYRLSAAAATKGVDNQGYVNPVLYKLNPILYPLNSVLYQLKPIQTFVLPKGIKFIELDTGITFPRDTNNIRYACQSTLSSTATDCSDVKIRANPFASTPIDPTLDPDEIVSLLKSKTPPLSPEETLALETGPYDDFVWFKVAPDGTVESSLSTTTTYHTNSMTLTLKDFRNAIDLTGISDPSTAAKTWTRVARIAVSPTGATTTLTYVVPQ